jgi:hypothetical protein
MRFYNAYINLKAAQSVDSGFITKKIAKKMHEDEEQLWTLAEKEEEAEKELDAAERNSDIDKITEAQRDEIKDIEDAVNYSFNVIRDAVLVIHTELNELQELIAHDDVLKNSGFPREVADELEKMLNDEVDKIMSHLRKVTCEGTLLKRPSEENNDSDRQEPEPDEEQP